MCPCYARLLQLQGPCSHLISRSHKPDFLFISKLDTVCTDPEVHGAAEVGREGTWVRYPAGRVHRRLTRELSKVIRIQGRWVLLVSETEYAQNLFSPFISILFWKAVFGLDENKFDMCKAPQSCTPIVPIVPKLWVTKDAWGNIFTLGTSIHFWRIWDGSQPHFKDNARHSTDLKYRAGIHSLSITSSAESIRWESPLLFSSSNWKERQDFFLRAFPDFLATKVQSALGGSFWILWVVKRALGYYTCSCVGWGSRKKLWHFLVKQLSATLDRTSRTQPSAFSIQRKVCPAAGLEIYILPSGNQEWYWISQNFQNNPSLAVLTDEYDFAHNGAQEYTISINTHVQISYKPLTKDLEALDSNLDP